MGKGKNYKIVMEEKEKLNKEEKPLKITIGKQNENKKGKKKKANSDGKTFTLKQSTISHNRIMIHTFISSPLPVALPSPLHLCLPPSGHAGGAADGGAGEGGIHSGDAAGGEGGGDGASAGTEGAGTAAGGGAAASG